MDKPANCRLIPRAEFDDLARDKAFDIGPFISGFGDGYGDPYIPPRNRNVWGRLKSSKENITADGYPPEKE